jgi:hypothetical protein
MTKEVPIINPHTYGQESVPERRRFPRSFLLTAFFLITLTASQAGAQSLSINLKNIGHISSQGRVQDKEFNPNLPQIDEIIKAGPAAIPFLEAKLEDTAIIKSKVLDGWPRIRVGDLAWFILYDFFTTKSQISTLPEPGLFAIFGGENLNQPGWASWSAVVNKTGRKGIRKAVEAILAPYQGKIVWDERERCFMVLE